MQALLPFAPKTSYRGLPFNDPLPQSLLNIDEKTRTNGFPWRGQFSPQLVEALLTAYCPPGSFLLDPFSGSGTTLLEAASLELPAAGFEVNPAAWLLTRVYTMCNLTPVQREAGLWAVGVRIAGFWDLELNEIERNLQDLSRGGGPIGIVAGALVILMDLFQNKVTRAHCERTLQRLEENVKKLPFSNEPVTAGLADARALPLSAASVDFVLTSPPYINVFNYHQHYRRSAEILGHNLLHVARSEIGSNRANRGNRFLTVIQYCLDIAAVLKEICRVCKPNAKIIFVIGHESKVLGVPFLNAELVACIAKQTGAFKLVLTQSRWYTNKFGFRIREDLLHLEPSKAKCESWDAVARSAAKAALRIGLKTVVEKNRYALSEAIEQVRSIEGTPLFKRNEQANCASYASS